VMAVGMKAGSLGTAGSPCLCGRAEPSLSGPTTGGREDHILYRLLTIETGQFHV